VCLSYIYDARFLKDKLQVPGNNPEESTRHSKHGESLKLRNYVLLNLCDNQRNA
jgi:hypothetical protein